MIILLFLAIPFILVFKLIDTKFIIFLFNPHYISNYSSFLIIIMFVYVSLFVLMNHVRDLQDFLFSIFKEPSRRVGDPHTFSCLFCSLFCVFYLSHFSGSFFPPCLFLNESSYIIYTETHSFIFPFYKLEFSAVSAR